MKKIFVLIFSASILFFINNVKANFDFTLKDYLDKKDLEDGSTQIYL